MDWFWSRWQRHWASCRRLAPLELWVTAQHCTAALLIGCLLSLFVCCVNCPELHWCCSKQQFTATAVKLWLWAEWKPKRRLWVVLGCVVAHLWKELPGSCWSIQRTTQGLVNWPKMKKKKLTWLCPFTITLQAFCSCSKSPQPPLHTFQNSSKAQQNGW